MDYTKDMETACELLHEQIADLIRKVKNNGMSIGDLDKLDKLTHSLKSVKGTMKMEQEMDGEYSGMYPYMGGTYRGSGNTGSSYTRGRNARRDSMGRYSRNDLADKVRELMDEAPDEHTRQEIRRLADMMDNA